MTKRSQSLWAGDLARERTVSVATVWRTELAPVTLPNEAAIRRALEAAGVDFIEDNGGGEGVRFRKPQRSAEKNTRGGTDRDTERLGKRRSRRPANNAAK